MFNLILNNHPKVQAEILRNDTENDFISVDTVEGVLLEGSGDPAFDIQMGEGNYRFFTDTNFLDNISLKPSELRGCFLKINGDKYEITQAKNNKTNFVNITKLILTRYEGA